MFVSTVTVEVLGFIEGLQDRFAHLEIRGSIPDPATPAGRGFTGTWCIFAQIGRPRWGK